MMTESWAFDMPISEPSASERRRMSSAHVRAWRDNIEDRVAMLKIEPGTLVALIDELLDAREEVA
jgi:hypothetical protein